MTMTTTDIQTPFKALLAGWSLIVVVFAVAGYSFRWNYYYNFGLHSLVLTAPLENLPVYAIEIARNPIFIFDLLWLGIIYLLPFQLALLALQKSCNSQNERISLVSSRLSRAFALDNPFFVDALRAALIILVAFQAGGEAGYRSYKTNVVENTSRLPKVTMVAQSNTNFPDLACDTRTFKNDETTKMIKFIGEAEVVSSLIAGKLCSTKRWSWRLLMRDEKFVYLFATVKDSRLRPETLVIPNANSLTLIFH